MSFRAVARTTFALVLPTLLALSLAACAGGDAGDDDDDDDDDDGGEGEGEGEGAELIADALLAYVDRCGIGLAEPGSFGLQAEPILFETLTEQFTGSFRDLIVEQFSSDAVIINEALLGACIDAIEASPCGETDDLPAEAGCEAAVQGTIAQGDSCTADVECAGGNGVSCFFAPNAECGTCETEAAEDEGCIDRDCGDDLECIEDVCVVVGDIPPAFEVGDPCDPNGDECDLFDTGLACVDDGGGGNECVPSVVVQIGETCDPDTRQRYCENLTSVNFCVDDGTGVGECTARPDTGETCLLGVFCNATEAICVDGTCALGGEEGALCDSADPIPCQLAFSCGTEDTCTPLFTPPEPATCE